MQSCVGVRVAVGKLEREGLYTTQCMQSCVGVWVACSIGKLVREGLYTTMHAVLCRSMGSSRQTGERGIIHYNQECNNTLATMHIAILYSHCMHNLVACSDCIVFVAQYIFVVQSLTIAITKVLDKANHESIVPQKLPTMRHGELKSQYCMHLINIVFSVKSKCKREDIVFLVIGAAIVEHCL